MHRQRATRCAKRWLPPAWIHAGAITCVTALAGCGTAEPPAALQPLKLEDIPPAFVETAKKELPGVRFDSVFRKPNGTLEIRGREKNGKVREVEIRPDGTIDEVE